MDRVLSRRDFLKLATLGTSAGALAHALPQALSALQPASQKPNVLILVFDAMSARHLSLYGYRRQTTPNLERFAERSLVYHAHNSAGSFTTPGTSSLLTGTLPWTHRAINFDGLISRQLVERNIFQLLGSEYHRFAYTQNILANYILGQFKPDIDTLLPPESFSVFDRIIGTHLGAVPGTYRAFDDFLFRDGSPPASLLLGLADRIQLHRREARTTIEAYPRGLPRAGDYPIFFDLREVYDGVNEVIRSLLSPYFAYIHLWSPHDPYKPSLEFDNYFKDFWSPPIKPNHRFGDTVRNSRLISKRKNYDEYIANVDAEFGRLIEALTDEGRLQNTIVVVTADHGEMLERGVEGHITRLIYEPIVHIPLLISIPDMQVRRDVFTPTNSIDVLPSLLHLTGLAVPEWIQGQLLPGVGGQEDRARSSFMVDAKDNPAYAPLKAATIALRVDQYKLIYYTGYESEDSYELYDLESDYEELNDLYPSLPAVLNPLKEELIEAFHAANQTME